MIVSSSGQEPVIAPSQPLSSITAGAEQTAGAAVSTSGDAARILHPFPAHLCAIFGEDRLCVLKAKKIRTISAALRDRFFKRLRPWHMRERAILKLVDSEGLLYILVRYIRNVAQNEIPLMGSYFPQGPYEGICVFYQQGIRERDEWRFWDSYTLLHLPVTGDWRNNQVEKEWLQRLLSGLPCGAMSWDLRRWNWKEGPAVHKDGLPVYELWQKKTPSSEEGV